MRIIFNGTRVVPGMLPVLFIHTVLQPGSNYTYTSIQHEITMTEHKFRIRCASLNCHGFSLRDLRFIRPSKS